MNFYQVAGVILLSIIPCFLIAGIYADKQIKNGVSQYLAFEEATKILVACWVSFSILFLGIWLIRQ